MRYIRAGITKMQMREKDELEVKLSQLTKGQDEYVSDYRRGAIDAIEYSLGRKDISLDVEPSLTVDEIFIFDDTYSRSYT